MEYNLRDSLYYLKLYLKSTDLNTDMHQFKLNQIPVIFTKVLYQIYFLTMDSKYMRIKFKNHLNIPIKFRTYELTLSHPLDVNYVLEQGQGHGHLSKYFISGLIFHFFLCLYEKKISNPSLKKRSLDISLQHKNRASNKFSEKNFCTWPKVGLALRGLMTKMYLVQKMCSLLTLSALDRFSAKYKFFFQKF